MPTAVAGFVPAPFGLTFTWYLTYPKRKSVSTVELSE